MAQGFSVRITGALQISKKAKRLKHKSPKIVSDSMIYAAQQILVPAIQDEMRRNDNLFTGKLIKGVRAAGWSESKSGYLVVGAMGVPYAMDVEKGKGPHSPNKAKIRKYVSQKLGVSGKQGDALAAAIIASIKQKGTKAHPAIEPAFKANSQRFLKATYAQIGLRINKV